MQDPLLVAHKAFHRTQEGLKQASGSLPQLISQYSWRLVALIFGGAYAFSAAQLLHATNRGGRPTTLRATAVTQKMRQQSREPLSSSPGCTDY